MGTEGEAYNYSICIAYHVRVLDPLFRKQFLGARSVRAAHVSSSLYRVFHDFRA